MDQGKEWYLMLSVQQALSSLRRNGSKAPYIQTSSKKKKCKLMQNHIVERMWSEINTRVNYPIKTILVGLLDDEQISMDNPLHFFAVSWLSIRVAFVGIKLGIIILYQVCMSTRLHDRNCQLDLAVFVTWVYMYLSFFPFLFGWCLNSCSVLGRRKGTMGAHIPIQIMRKGNKATQISLHHSTASS